MEAATPQRAQYPRAIVAAARVLGDHFAKATNTNSDDVWNLYAEDLKHDAAAALDAVGFPELLTAAKHVAFSNGFDAALPDKMEALRAAITKATGGAQ